MKYEDFKRGQIVTDGKMDIRVDGPCKSFWFPGTVVSHTVKETEWCYVGYSSEFNADFFRLKQ